MEMIAETFLFDSVEKLESPTLKVIVDVII